MPGRRVNRAGYQPFESSQNETEMEGQTHGPEVMVHIVPEANRLRWNHIEDLDTFLSRVYYYHQRHGFYTILFQEICELGLFLYIVGFASFLAMCVDYPILFKDKVVDKDHPFAKVTIGDALIPAGQCLASFPLWLWIVLSIAMVFWVIKFAFFVYNTTLNWEIRSFYRTALGIEDNDVDNLTWYDVQKRIRVVQREQQMCIHKQDLTELDIYHRILRFKNYMVAMTNKGLIPLGFNIPFLGETRFMTHGMKYSLEFLLFRGPWAPFEDNWHLREDFKKVSKRKELAEELSRRFAIAALICVFLAPLIFTWQVVLAFFNYAELTKRDPSNLGLRRWSLYSRLYLRHFNELDHELNARLSRAYRPAAKYMSIFTSPMLTVVARNTAFTSGAMLSPLIILPIVDEDVLSVEHVLLFITVFGAVIAVSRAFIPDENTVISPERQLGSVLAHTHYSPDHWKGRAHTSHTRNEFSALFQYKFEFLGQEIISPILTPFWLYFCVRPKSLDFVDFFRNFTVEVAGVGDVCSFAQMDVRKHGNPDWQTSTSDMDHSKDQHMNRNNNAYVQAEDGKTELSLVHFTHTNPEWSPPNGSGAYINTLRERAARDASALPTVLEENAFYSSLNSLSSFGNEYSNAVTNILRENNLMGNSFHPQQRLDNFPVAELTPTSHLQTFTPAQQSSFRGYLNNHEGPMQRSINRGIVSGTTTAQQSGVFQGNSPSINNSTISFARSFAQFPQQGLNNADLNTMLELNAVDMSLDALYIHELHHMEMRRRSAQNIALPFPLPPDSNPPTNRSTQEGQVPGQGQGELIISQFQLQPQVHNFAPLQYPLQTSSTSSSGDSSVMGRQSEKTSLLSTRYSNYNNDPLI